MSTEGMKQMSPEKPAEEVPVITETDAMEIDSECSPDIPDQETQRPEVGLKDAVEAAGPEEGLQASPKGDDEVPPSAEGAQDTSSAEIGKDAVEKDAAKEAPVQSMEGAQGTVETDAAKEAPVQGVEGSPDEQQSAAGGADPGSAAAEEQLSSCEEPQAQQGCAGQAVDHSTSQDVERRIELEVTRRVEAEVARRLEAEMDLRLESDTAEKKASQEQSRNALIADVERKVKEEVNNEVAKRKGLIQQARQSAQAQRGAASQKQVPSKSPRRLVTPKTDSVHNAMPEQKAQEVGNADKDAVRDSAQKKRKIPLHETPAKRKRASPTMAEKVMQHQKRTPPRFRSTPRTQSMAPAVQQRRPSVRATTTPKAPNLSTSRRASIRLSLGSLPAGHKPEDKALDKILDRVLDKPQDKPQPKRPSAGRTVPKPFTLGTESRASFSRSTSLATANRAEPVVPFKATPLNRKILSSVGQYGIPRVEKRPSTVPKEFGFMKREQQRKSGLKAPESKTAEGATHDGDKENAPSCRNRPLPKAGVKRPRPAEHKTSMAPPAAKRPKV